MFVLVALLACSGPAARVSAPTIPMADGVRLAADVVLPVATTPERVPVVLIQTRYWRSFQLKFSQAPGAIPIGPRDDVVPALVAAGYGVVVLDVRGTGASEGAWPRPWSAQEVADMGAVIDWIVAQPWSDGTVGTYGVSYEGTTAMLAATQHRPALKAVLAREIEWDLVDELIAPGGVRNTVFVDGWGRSVAALDRGAWPELFPAGPGWIVNGPRRTDDDPEGTALAARLAARPVPTVAAQVERVRAPDDPFGEGGPAARAVGPAGWEPDLATSTAAIGLWGSWWDGGTADAVLRADAAVHLVDARIGPWVHEGDATASPLARGHEEAIPLADVVAFFDAHLRATTPAAPRRWYVAGEERWAEAPSWPSGAPWAWSLTPDHQLVAADTSPPPGAVGALDVDFAATNGPDTRWTAGLLHPLPAPDRRDMPGLLSFATGPLGAPLEAFGSPTFRCQVSAENAPDSPAPEVALHAYLEAVEADGSVRLLTEGVLRTGTAPVELRLRPVGFALAATEGLRLSIAGADAGTFERVPASGPARIGLAAPCTLEVPGRGGG